MATEALVVQGLSKSFNERPALDGACLTVRSGEIHALVGQNGCGKSTLIKILAGYHTPDGDEAVIAVNGKRLSSGDPHAARGAGLRFIHQDLGLVGELDPVDNLALGESYEGRWWLSDRRERRAAAKVMESYGVQVDLEAPVRNLGAARQTFIAIVRALRSGLGDGNVLILDEPTAALPDDEVQHLFALLQTLRSRGVAIVLVTHRLSEVLAIADRVTVLRDGRALATEEVASLDHERLAELIIGRPVESFHPLMSGAPASPPVLEICGLGGEGVEDVSITVNRAEIVGVAGIIGSGYETLLALAFGAYPRRTGTVALNGAAIRNDIGASVAIGLGYVPADRKRFGAILTWSLDENLTLPSLPTRLRVWLSESRERSESTTWLKRLGVTAPGDRGFWTLSGGNQQRVVLAKWLRHGAKCLLIDEPSAGVDIGARHEIYAAMAESAQTGTCFLIASSDSEELVAICDRVIVMRNGRIGATLAGDQLTLDRVLAETLKPSEVHNAA